MEYDDLPEIPCEPPIPAEIGDVWYCDGCARKFHYVLMTLDNDVEIEAWFTSEIG